MQLDDNFQRLMQELGNAINDSLAESEKIGEVMGRIRAAGYDLFLVFEVTIGFNKHDEADAVPYQKLSADQIRKAEFRLTNQDAQFLRALKISIEKERE